jgi:NAD(P)-dependent dehydrogenase (short-subunit alcohol dehydrogenase family)
MSERSVLVTGGTGALGTAVTAAFLRAGATVTVPVVAEAEAERMAREIGPDSARVLLVRANLLDEDTVRRLIDGMPRVDAVVHLVGGFAMGPTDTFALDAYRAQIDTNLTTTFLVLKHALRRMKPQGSGRIVTVASRAALEPGAEQAAYAAAKAGVLAMTRAVATETRGTDITANCVLPSTIDTPANRRAMGEANAHLWVAPAQLAETIVHLASPAAGHLRGTALRAFGGV